MTNLASIAAMTLLAACMAAPFLLEQVFVVDLLTPAPAAVTVIAPPLIGLAAR